MRLRQRGTGDLLIAGSSAKWALLPDQKVGFGMASGSEPILALDFGGTKISAAAVLAGEEEWLALEREASPPGANSDSDIRIATELARKVLAGRSPAAIGVSFGGPVWASTGTVKLSHHVPGWEGVPLARLLGAEFGAEAVVENDGIIAALGEHRFGAGRGVNSLIYLTVSTGVGGGLIVDGEIWHGRDGMAGHIGHYRLEPDGPPCVCGSRGCLESIAAGPSIAAEARRRLASEPQSESALAKLPSAEITGKAVADAARSGDRLALEVMTRAARALGVAIGSAANLFNPDRVLVGGGVSKSGDVLWPEMRRMARETAMPEVSLDLEPAGLGDDAPLWGAVALAMDHLPDREGVGQA